MVISINGSPIVLNWDSILLWVLVGVVAGFLASHLVAGHGMGLLGDLVIGILGALFGGIVLAGILHFQIAITGHPILSSIVMASIGAAILLIVFRLFSGSRGGYRRRAF